MATIKQYMDMSNLTLYDGLIKNFISTEDAASYKTILLSADGTAVYLYKKKNAVLGTDIPDFTINLGTGITLNGVNKAGLSATLYAPESGGTSGQVLVSNGNNAPSWENLRGYIPQYSAENSQLIFSIGTIPNS